MIELYVKGQSLRCSSPSIAANSREYLQLRCYFQDEDWKGLSKWAHFRQGDKVLDLALQDDCIVPSQGLDLSIGAWQLYLTGHRESLRITTVPVILQVRQSGLIDEPLHQLPMSVAEQLDSKASLALDKVKAIEKDIASGILGGQSFKILGYYEDLETLKKEIRDPKPGDAYGVGREAPYSIFVYDGVKGIWLDNGSIQGPPGERGPAGACFKPLLDSSGNLSWSNDAGLPDPPPVNIMGQKGEQGEKGKDGLSPYQAAVKEGYTGTENSFNWALVHMSGHAAQHSAGGTDPLKISQDMIEKGAVSREKLAEELKPLVFKEQSVPVELWVEDKSYADFPFRAGVSLIGLTAAHYPEVVLGPDDALGGNYAPVTESYDGGIYLYAAEKPEAPLKVLSVVAALV